MPGPQVVPVVGDTALPRRVDVVVIGGGIIGASTALELAERGLRVALCEKGQIAGEQSSRNWGWVRISQRDPREVPLMAEAIRIWRDLDRRVGADTGYRQCGIAFALASDLEYAANEAWLRNLEGYQLEARMISPREVRELFPDMVPATKGALLNRADGRAEPQKAASAIAETARARGAAILTDCAVRVVEHAAGKVSGVVTERGTIACDAVVLAGGAWSRLFLGNEGLALPQLKVTSSVLRTEPLEGGPDITISGDGFSVRKRADGGYTVSNTDTNVFDLTPDAFRLMLAYLPALRARWGDMTIRLGRRFLTEARERRHWGPGDVTPFEKTRTHDPVPSQRLVDRTLARLAEAFPVFAQAKVAQRWAGLIDVTPDAIPVISAVDGRPGLFVATGFSGHGFGIGPGAGLLMADLVTGRKPVVDPHAFRFSRFSDGSKLHLYTDV